MRNKVLAVGVAIGLTGIALAQAQRSSPGDAASVMALTAMDYIQIKQLVNRYAFALDTGSRKGYDYADLFTPDGVFHSNTRGRTQGRDQLADLARGERRGPLQVNHYIVNHIIEPTATGAIGRQYLINISHDDVVPPVPQPVNQWALIGQKRGSLDMVGGQYEDVYAKTPLGWRFQSRGLVRSESGAGRWRACHGR